MINVLILCHGNICRSPMCEFMLKDKVKKLGIEDHFYITSKAVSSEEIGNDMYIMAKLCLDEHEIPYERRKASKVTLSDYDCFDYIFLMDQSNARLIQSIIPEDKEGKISLFLKDRSIADPWYTGDFEKTYHDIEEGIDLFLEDLKKEGKL